MREAIFCFHASIGRAIWFTTVTITIGFSSLLRSRFVPTTYLGILAAFAMLAALTVNVTLLPTLLEKLKPFTLPADRYRER